MPSQRGLEASASRTVRQSGGDEDLIFSSKKEVSPNLKELAGRIHKLSYRELTEFSTVLRSQMEKAHELTTSAISTSLLATSDELAAK